MVWCVVRVACCLSSCVCWLFVVARRLLFVVDYMFVFSFLFFACVSVLFGD